MNKDIIFSLDFFLETMKILGQIVLFICIIVLVIGLMWWLCSAIGALGYLVFMTVIIIFALSAGLAYVNLN